MTAQLTFNIFVTTLTFFLWFVWKTNTWLNIFMKIASLISWVAGAVLIAHHFGFIVKI
jgi:hypothetical protein